MPDTETAPYLNPDYVWPTTGMVASQADIAASIAHVKAWHAAQLAPLQTELTALRAAQGKAAADLTPPTPAEAPAHG